MPTTEVNLERKRLKQIMKSKWVNILLVLATLVVFTSCENKKQTAENEKIKCSISIECGNVLNHMEELSEDKKDIIPKEGIILEETEVEIVEGTSVYEVLTNICREREILMEGSFTVGTGSAYVEGIANLYEFDCGELSGWQYSVNGEHTGISSSDYPVKDGDVIEWRYTCDLGEDLK